MTITPEERQQWRAAESPYSLDKRITRRLDALEKAEDDVEAAQIGQIAAYKLAEDDAAEEIGRLKERAEKAERERDALYQEWISQPKPGAERKRFELLVPLRVHMISNRVPAITTPNKSLYDAPISGM